MPGLGSDENRARRYDINNGVKHLLGLVTEHQDLLKVLHYTYSDGINSCYYLISSHVALLYIMRFFGRAA